MANYQIAQLDAIDPVPCPCGSAQRAFTNLPGSPASVHQVVIKADSETHYHKKLTEIYVVLEGEGEIDLDGQSFPLKPLTTVMIRPGCRHRARGQLKILNIAIPAFDPADEWKD